MRSWLLVAGVLFTGSAEAHNSGSVTGRSTSGCGSCHGRSADSAVTAAITPASTQVAPGDVVTVTLAVSSTRSSHTAAGLDLSASGGTLHAGTGTHLVGRELTQTTRKGFSGGGTSWDVTWTAPSQPGTYTFRAVGNAVNGDSRDSSSDGWAIAPATTVEVVVPVDTDLPPADTEVPVDTEIAVDTEVPRDTAVATDTDVGGGGGGGGDTDVAGDTDTSGTGTAATGCGCDVGGSPAWAGLVLVGAFARRRRRR